MSTAAVLPVALGERFGLLVRACRRRQDGGGVLGLVLRVGGPGLGPGPGPGSAWLPARAQHGRPPAAALDPRGLGDDPAGSVLTNGSGPPGPGRAAPCCRPSYWHRPGEHPLQYTTIGELTASAADKYGGQEALVCVQQGKRLSFAELLEQCDRLAAGLLGLGLRRGDRVAIWAGNSWRWVVAKLAAARAGLVSVDLNPQYREAELAHCLRLTRVSAVLLGDRYRGGRLYDVLKNVVPQLPESTTLPDLKVVIALDDTTDPGTLQLSEVMAAPTAAQVEQVRQDQGLTSPEDVACIQMSSGTTGKPKAILLVHRAVVNNSFLVGRRLALHEKTHRVCLQVPLFHAFGTILALTPALHYGAVIVLPAPAFSAAASLRAVRQERCSMLMGTPTMYVDLVSAVHGEALQAEAALVAGAPITPHLAKQMNAVLGVRRICNGYGLSESSGLLFQGRPGDSVQRMGATVGYICDHTEVKVVDENGDMVPFGVPGELWARSYTIMKGYFNDPEATAAAVTEDGWFRTGDKFVLHEDGYGSIQGRIKDMIIRGGENIYPKEVESILAEHPDILEVEVVGVADERLGEEVCACVRLQPGSPAERVSAGRLRDFCVGKMSDYKVPRYCLVVEDFPRTLSGKIQKYLLRDQCAAAQAKGDLDDNRRRASDIAPGRRVWPQSGDQ
ncbi:Medium-chain acyl-CoA ligase ACSF2, mitochondrial [Frankliniella fusca]|uniref:Medium-chain acyl-CoA ligase ACSF2, mitochondrial n=1 Tax=Frankliniella fusca TaxID=407009 RepID=A0AAE1LN06_9NEOP|nr:Medium-chain acyl-CoA ligase ACSF2, mitochondrial [Frankliniella fusca]